MIATPEFRGTDSPETQEMRVGLGALCNGKTDANIRVTVRGRSGDLNEARFTVNDLIAKKMMFPGQSKGQLVFLKF